MQYSFTLISLLLERHLEIFRLGKRVVLDSGELRAAADSILWVLGVLQIRVAELRGLSRPLLSFWLLTNQYAAMFKSQIRDPIVEFRSFSFGLVRAPYPQCKLAFTPHTHSTNTSVAHPYYGRRKPSEICNMGTSTTTTTMLSLTTILNLTG